MLKLMVRGGVSRSVVTERGLLIQGVKRNGGSRDKGARRRRREHRDELGGSEAAGCAGGLVIEGGVIGVVEVGLGGRRVRRTVDREPVGGDRVEADAGEGRLGGQLIEDRGEIGRNHEDKVHSLSTAVAPGRAIEEGRKAVSGLTEEGAEIVGGCGARTTSAVARDGATREAQGLADTQAEDVGAVSKDEHGASAYLVLQGGPGRLELEL